jgi:glucose-6-phosphate 1-epimerase
VKTGRHFFWQKIPAIIQVMHLPPQIKRLDHAGHASLQLNTRFGSAIIALHGAHLLSWLPTGQRDVFWLSPQALPEPAAIRGGVPVCWPWFARQGQPVSAAQHGPVRNLRWQIGEIHSCSDDEISLSLQPCDNVNTLSSAAPGLQLSLRITLGLTLKQTLHTHNLGSQPFALTQALHSYFAVGQAAQIGIEGLTGLPYQDRLRDLAFDVQRSAFALDQACDRTYAQPASDASTQASHPNHRYVLVDPVWQRRIVIDTQGSQSVVVWNPGSAGARTMADVADGGWQDFFCVETSNAGPDVVVLAAGAAHSLGHTLSVIS